MKILWKLYLGYAALVLVATAAMGVVADGWLKSESLSGLERDLEAKSLLLAELMREPLQRGEYSQDLIERVADAGRATGTRLTVLAADGTVIADSDFDPASMDNHANRPEVLESTRRAGPVTEIRYSHTAKRDTLYSARPVIVGEKTVGHVRAAVTLDAVLDQLWLLRGKVLLGAGVALIFALLGGYLLARSMTEPLSVMTDAARRLAAGETDVQLPIRQERDELGSLSRALGSMATELRQRLHSLESDRSKLAAILSSMVEGVIAVDQEERVLHMNEVAVRLLEAKPDWQIGTSIWEVTRVRDVSELLAATLRDGQQSTTTVRLQGFRQDTLLELHASPLSLSGGSVAGAVVVIHDVTALRKLEDHRRDFVANVSHELKTPLTAIYGLVDTLLDDPDMPQTTRTRFLGKVHKQASRLSTLVMDILTLSKLESGNNELQREVLDLREVMNESVRFVAGSSKGEKVLVDVELPEASVRVQGDREALRQVVDNLLDNAVKYTPDGGNVWLRLTTNDGSALVEVQDTGVGIPPKSRERIFERFYRVDKARSRELGGTGLGLSIVKHVTLSHGGSVSVESEVGVGSTFRVTLPLSAAPVTV